MTDEEGLFWLNDRLEKIKQISQQENLEANSYMPYSFGKDSTVLHHLLDIALPNNTIPRVFINTGLEYNAIRKKAFNDAKADKRIIIINSNVNIKRMLEKEGYPFKSKEHSLKVSQYKQGSRADSVLKYKQGFENIEYSRFQCPKKLLYQFEDEFKLKISNKCCYKLKKDVIHLWEKENKKIISMTGMRNEEGGAKG